MKAGVAIVISDKLNFKPKAAIRHEEGYYIILKGFVQQEDLTVLKNKNLNLVYKKYDKLILNLYFLSLFSSSLLFSAS